MRSARSASSSASSKRCAAPYKRNTSLVSDLVEGRAVGRATVVRVLIAVVADFASVEDGVAAARDGAVDTAGGAFVVGVKDRGLGELERVIEAGGVEGLPAVDAVEEDGVDVDGPVAGEGEAAEGAEGASEGEAPAGEAGSEEGSAEEG